jgi:hypothetical protein
MISPVVCQPTLQSFPNFTPYSREMSSVSMATSFPKNCHCRSCAHRRRSKRAAKLLFQMTIDEVRACSARGSWFLVTTRSAGLWPRAGARPVEGRPGSMKLERGAIDGGVRPSDAAVNVAACRPKSVPDRAPSSVSV